VVTVPKKVTQDVDFTSSLRSIISKQYGESPDDYSSEISTLNRTRQDALRGSAGSDQTARDLLYKYFGQLELLELRFPDLRVPFPWSDAFTKVKISQQSLAYEKASVIFNIAATLSSLGATSESRSSNEGLKRSFHSFRASAGMFVYINENFLHAPSTDLSKDVIKVLINLMLSQATEIFIETMPGGGSLTFSKSCGLRSKLCLQLSLMYSSLVEDLKEWVTKGVFLKEWSLLCQVKSKYFSSLAQFNKSLFDQNQGNYGHALSRLNLSDTLAKESLKICQQFSSSYSTTTTSTSLPVDSPTSLLEVIKNYQLLVGDFRQKAQKDNDIVYNEVVPSEASLPPIEKPSKPIAEPIPIHEIYSSPEVQKLVGQDLFLKLIPLSVHESSSMYSEEKAKLIRLEQEKCDLGDQELESALEFMGLPKSLQRFKQSTSLSVSVVDPGPQIRQWVNEIKTYEFQTPVQQEFKKIEQKKQSIAHDLSTGLESLDLESRSCEEMRFKFGHLWEQSPSSSLTNFKHLKQVLKEQRKVFDFAKESDEKVLKLWNSIKLDVVEIMCEPSGNKLEQIFIDAAANQTTRGEIINLLDTDFTKDDDQDTSQAEETSRKADTISELLVRLNKVKKERSEVLKDLKDKVQSDDISHLLVLNRGKGGGGDTSLFANELEKFRPHQQRLSQTVTTQQTILTEINQLFKQLTESPQAKETLMRWESIEKSKKTLVNRFGRVVQVYQDVKLALEKGFNFYSDLDQLLTRGGGLNDQVDQYLRSRNEERKRMAAEADLRQRLEGSLNLNDNTSGYRSPPPPPIPPTSPYGASSYSRPGAPSALPPPPPPVNSSYGLPPPPAPISYNHQQQPNYYGQQPPNPSPSLYRPSPPQPPSRPYY